MVKHLSTLTELPLEVAEDRIQLMQSMGDIATFSGAYRAFALDLCSFPDAVVGVRGPDEIWLNDGRGTFHDSGRRLVPRGDREFVAGLECGHGEIFQIANQQIANVGDSGVVVGVGSLL